MEETVKIELRKENKGEKIDPSVKKLGRAK